MLPTESNPKDKTKKQTIRQTQCTPEGVSGGAPVEALLRLRAVRDGGHALQSAALHATHTLPWHQSIVKVFTQTSIFKLTWAFIHDVDTVQI